MRIGTATRTLTPDRLLYLGGFASRSHPMTGVADDIGVRAVSFTEDGRTVVLASCDLLGLDPEAVVAIKETVTARTGLEPEAILVACTHTHSAPLVMSLLACGLREAAYEKWVGERIQEAIVQSLEDQREARLAFFQAEVDAFGYWRRQRGPDGRVTLARQEPSGAEARPIDRQLACVYAVDERGRPLAVVVNFPCHPVMLAGNSYVLSADYPGELARQVEAHSGASVCVFLQGGGGDINPMELGDDVERMRRAGRRLAEVVLAGLNQATPLSLGPIDCRLACLDLPVQPACDEAALRALAGGGSAEAGADRPRLPMDRSTLKSLWARLMLERVAQGRLDRCPVTVQGIRIGDWHVGATSLEMFSATGLAIKQTARGPAMAVGYANGVVGYMPTPEELPRGGYEVDAAYVYYGQAGPFGAEAEPAVRRFFAEIWAPEGRPVVVGAGQGGSGPPSRQEEA